MEIEIKFEDLEKEDIPVYFTIYDGKKYNVNSHELYLAIKNNEKSFKKIIGEYTENATYGIENENITNEIERLSKLVPKKLLDFYKNLLPYEIPKNKKIDKENEKKKEKEKEKEVEVKIENGLICVPDVQESIKITIKEDNENEDKNKDKEKEKKKENIFCGRSKIKERIVNEALLTDKEYINKNYYVDIIGNYWDIDKLKEIIKIPLIIENCIKDKFPPYMTNPDIEERERIKEEYKKIGRKAFD